jgi:two-component system OmpR family sensor kinase
VTLRVRLTIALVVLVGVGLIVADVATYTALRSFLVQRVDQQLRAAIGPAAGMLEHAMPGMRPGGGPGDAIPNGSYVAAFDASGQLVVDRFALTYESATQPAKPDLPLNVGTQGPGSSPFTVGSVHGGLRYRVLVTPITGGGSLVVAIPLADVTDTLRRLLAIALFVTVGALAGMGVLSWWTVRRELQPLERIETTAGAIAAGDLSQRVEEIDPRTEVGRLGVALNVMLGRIEGEMDERRAAEESLRRFLADASHELRTPLTSIRGYAELFRRGADASPEDTALAMRRIEQEGERMGVLVDDLLFLARSGQGESRPIAHEPVDLAAMAHDAVHDARAVDPSREIALDTPDGLTVDGDEPRLRQVFANLLSNAIAHTPAGTPVSVRVNAEDGWAKIAVSDRGPGLTAEQAAKVFEPFYRADPSRGRVVGDEDGGGAGLGLSIVAAIAEAHGGSATVTGEPNQGATFTVRLPLGPQPDGAPG